MLQFIKHTFKSVPLLNWNTNHHMNKLWYRMLSTPDTHHHSIKTLMTLVELWTYMYAVVKNWTLIFRTVRKKNWFRCSCLLYSLLARGSTLPTSPQSYLLHHLCAMWCRFLHQKRTKSISFVIKNICFTTDDRLFVAQVCKQNELEKEFVVICMYCLQNTWR